MKSRIVRLTKKVIGNKVILSIIIISAFFCNTFNSYVCAKYTEQFIMNVTAQIAKPIVKIEGEETKQITVFAPQASYLFSVKNYNDLDEINEVSMEYYIEIISEKLELLEIHLYKEDEEIILTDYRTKKINLRMGEKQEDNYRLEVQFLENIEENLLENVQANLQIKIYSIQIEK